jgi:hypothetical protein
MKILVATTETQGQREGDFCWAEEGELVSFGSECDHALEPLDGPCGCRRSLVGLRTGKSTTTVRVVDWPDLNLWTLGNLVTDAWTRGGWGRKMSRLELRRSAIKDAKNLATVGAYFSVGTILERRQDDFIARERLVA